MLYRVLADIVLIAHLVFIVFVVAGGLVVLRWRWAAAIHLPAAVYGALIEFVGWICPLTPLENALRRRGGQDGFEGGFVEHYLVPLIYPGELTRGVQIVLGLAVVGINVAIYGWVVSRWRNRHRQTRLTPHPPPGQSPP
ncbi:MAG TPA: DUF2784 domain-containing protein [Planctomycetaceae bacterium]|nr:DUF2784 domain-containing protein [Planctomycetaceae bacterium]